MGKGGAMRCGRMGCAQLLMAMAAHAAADEGLLSKEPEGAERLPGSFKWTASQLAEPRSEGLRLNYEYRPLPQAVPGLSAALGSSASLAAAGAAPPPPAPPKRDDVVSRVLDGIDRNWLGLESGAQAPRSPLAGPSLKFGDKASMFELRPRAHSMSITWSKSFN